MTQVNLGKSQKEADRHAIRRNNFWNQTVAQNNARLDGKNIPADVLDELKFIESVLLTQMSED